MVCLDTDFMVAVDRKNPEALKKLRELKEKRERKTVTPVTLTELYEGAYKTGKQTALDETEENLMSLEILDYDYDAAKEAGRLLSELGKSGEKIGEMDTLIGAIALRYGETLLTRNAKHFAKIPGLKVEKW